ncbi:unnamed protein product [Leptosia nina]|uniref:Uncharacterized protein n=1 Tax=Leptosia nina TaxID=320188 RepID=A0AAV1J2L6_9NEOP
MVVKSMLLRKSGSVRRPSTIVTPKSVRNELIVVPSHLGDAQREDILCESDSRVVDVIDLGAPVERRMRTAPARLTRPIYTPNPRLYPGQAVSKRAAARPRARRKRVFRRPVPNSRLYRPAPSRPAPAPPAPLRPAGAWPAPSRDPRPLETASRVALSLLSSPLVSSPPPDGRLLVTLPRLTHTMDTVTRHSTSPECSEGNAAPSEFLAEFLSAIMRRQYAEALKYCRLILQYEPQNATARGFYPLLQHKLDKQPEATIEPGETSSSDEANPPRLFKNAEVGGGAGQSGESGDLEGSGETGEESEPEEWERSGASCSSLELDSSPSRTDTAPAQRSTDSGWSPSESGASRSERDDNGNPAAGFGKSRRSPAHLYDEDDVQNDNAGGGGDSTAREALQESASSLQRLRAQFACSIK